MGCSDPYLSHLKAFGYNVVRLPRADLKPGQLLLRSGRDLSRVGEMTDLLTGLASPPEVSADNRTATLSGKQTGSLSIGVGLTLLGTIVGALGGSKLGLELVYERARSAVFGFEDVFENHIEPLKLDVFLGEADVNPRAAHVRELLFADEIYVTTSTIKSTCFTVEAADSGKHGVEVSVPELKQLVGGNVKVSADGDRAVKVTYEGKIPLVFGFQAAQLDYDDGRYRRFKGVKAGDVSLEAVAGALGAAPDGESVRLLSGGPFVGLSDLS